jgi:glycosyltransferase involved in cell wall biosynthesis
MRAAYVCADAGVPVFGTKGASVHVQAVAGALAATGARLTVLATRTGGAPPASLAGSGLVALPPAPRAEPAARERAALAANDALARALSALGPLDLVYERYSLWSHAAMEHARARGIPGVLEVNAPLIDEQAAHRVLVDRSAAEAVARRALAAATVVIAVSPGVAAWLERFPAAAGKVHVVPNGVDPARFGATPPAAPGRPFTVGFLGTLKPWHGLDTLVDAFAVLHARRPGARLRLIGDGPQAAAVRARLAVDGVAGAATLTGAVAPAAVPAELAAVDVGVAPYPDLRPFYFSPLKLVEYAAAGLPAVCSRVGALEDVVTDGVTGLLCPPGEPLALAAALERLADDPGLRARLGAAARERVLAEHTWDRVVARTLALAASAGPVRVPA